MSRFIPLKSLIITTFTLLIAAMTHMSAHAAIDNRAMVNENVSLKKQSTSFSKFHKIKDAPILNSHNSEHIINFDIPDTAWTTDISVMLSADPIGPVSGDTPIYVQFNSGEPKKINTKGRGFDARINLEASLVKARNNSLRIILAKPETQTCLYSKNGGWKIDLENSKINITSHAKSLNLRVGDIEPLFENPLTAPKSVSILSRGEHITALQNLIAQGVGLRFDDLPDFVNQSRRADVEFIAGTRDQIARYVRSPILRNTNGPRLIVDEGRPMKVILTGDTDDEVLSLAKHFAAYTLPRTRRVMTSPGEMVMQKALAKTENIITEDKKLSALGRTSFDANWSPADKVLSFDVADPKSSKGMVKLFLTTPKSILETSSGFSVYLNHINLGETALDKQRKSVSFEIPEGLLRAQNNILRLKADLNASDKLGCEASNYADTGLYLGTNSKIILTRTEETPLNDLSHMSATGAPFSDNKGQDSLVVLPSRRDNYDAALKFVANLAKTSGQAWTDASFIRDVRDITPDMRKKNILFISPASDLPEKIRTSAPSTFKNALNGTPSVGENLLPSKSLRYANNDGEKAIAEAVREFQTRNRIQSGGLATLFKSPYDAQRLSGVITSTPRYDFSRALNDLKQDHHWNSLQGRVVRWTDKTVLMTELATENSSFIRSLPTESMKAPTFEFLNLDRLAYVAPDWTWPKFNFPEIEFPKLNFWKNSETIPFETPSESFVSDQRNEAMTAANNSQFKEPNLPQPKSNFLNQYLGNESTSTSKRIQQDIALSHNVADVSGVNLGTSGNTEPAMNRKFTAPINKAAFQNGLLTLQKQAQMLEKKVERKLISLNIIQDGGLADNQNRLTAMVLLIILIISLIIVFFGFSDPKRKEIQYPLKDI